MSIAVIYQAPVMTCMSLTVLYKPVLILSYIDHQYKSNLGGLVLVNLVITRTEFFSFIENYIVLQQ